MDVRVGLWRKLSAENWCFWTVVVEKTLESPLDCKKIQPVHPKGDQSWVFTGRTDAEAETPILWPPDAKSWLIGKDPDAGRDWGQEEKRMIEDEMAGWHRWTWVWVNSGSGWWSGRSGVLWFVGSQRVGHDWATELKPRSNRSIIDGSKDMSVFTSFQSLRHVWLCDSMDCSTPGLPIHHQFSELSQTHVHWVGDAIQPPLPLLSPSPPTFNLPQHQGLFQWVSSSYQVAKVLEFQL